MKPPLPELSGINITLVALEDDQRLVDQANRARRARNRAMKKLARHQKSGNQTYVSDQAAAAEISGQYPKLDDENADGDMDAEDGDTLEEASAVEQHALDDQDTIGKQNR